MKKNALLFLAVLCFSFLLAQNKSEKKIHSYVTADKTELRLSSGETLSFTPFGQPLETQPCVFIDTTKTFQTLVGIGGALTDAAAETFAKLQPAEQQQLLKAYYDKKDGIGYSLGRTHINSCDFSSHMYTYVAENDASLKTFSVKPDEQYRIPLIKKAIAAAGGKLTLFISPWSPPAWMKTNNDMLHGGKLKPEYYQSWANYYVKFIKAYEAAGIPVWGLTLQNEPMAVQTWESCVYTAEDEANYIKKYLGPTLVKNNLSRKKLMIWYHNRDLLFQQASTILRDKEVAKYVWGVGFHWYENWAGGENTFDNVRKVKDAFPDKNVMLTEACNFPFSWEHIDDWKWGEIYGKNMMNDFNNGAVGWTDWNILLDEKGGPNHLENNCYAPVHCTKEGKLHFMNSFYYIGHFSKFIQPGAKRIITSSSRVQLLTTGFKNTDGKYAIVVMNAGDEKIEFRLWINGNAALTTALPHSIATYVIE